MKYCFLLLAQHTSNHAAYQGGGGTPLAGRGNTGDTELPHASKLLDVCFARFRKCGREQLDKGNDSAKEDPGVTHRT